MIFKFYNKTFLFGANNIVKNSDKNKYVFSGYGTTFDALGSWKFGNDLTRNIIILMFIIVYHLILIITKITFLVLVEGPTDDINGSIGGVGNMFSINFSKAKTKFCLSLHCNGDNSLLKEKNLK